jgi:hypothetical protein
MMALKSKKETVQAEIVEEEELPFPVNGVEEKTDEPTNEIAVVDQEQHLPDYAILNPEIQMRDKIEVAKDVANALSDVLDKQGLVKYGLNANNKKAGYVLAEGWNTLGTMLGITVVTEKVEPFTPLRQRKGKREAYGYKATVSLYQNGNKLCTAEAVADSNGFQKDEFAIYSMAQTRAMGKAYRMALSWIVKLAGYEAAPAEEMPNYRGDR